ncbi:TPA: DUF4231 domain-containing protein [Legionella pneumophila]|nr:DUF4231 domain-containing protein [Legionella pneumophila]HEM1535620.1 DUF4231 domain-containing protein [Legionella pneumophila]
MQLEDYPSLYRSSDRLSISSQRNFFLALMTHLIVLVIAAVLSFITIPSLFVSVLQLLALLSALSISIYLFALRPDRVWYSGRAVAESIKTITWRYISRAEPFQGSDTEAKTHFIKTLKAILDQNSEIFRAITDNLDTPHITEPMEQMRCQSLDQRWSAYINNRVENQLKWYAEKASFNKIMSKRFFIALISVNIIAVLCAVLRLVFVNHLQFWPTDILVAASASLLGWMQAKRFSELSASYALAAHEIGLIKCQSTQPTSDEDFSLFVSDTENAFSREHTQWVARKDI